MCYIVKNGWRCFETRRVLIITSSIDETTTYIISRYYKQADFFRVDVDKFDEYEFCIENEGWSISNDCFRITSEDIYSIYYRKPILPNLNIYDQQYHLMIQRDIIAVINGIVDGFSGKVLTKPSILRKTENKVYQMMYASRKGFNIPRSYIGNSRDDCIKYEKNTSIIKPITTGKTYGKNGWELYQTNIFKGVNEDIRLTPVYLQDYVLKQFEVRVTIVGKKIYPVRIDTENQVDWRADYQNHRYAQTICPDDVIMKCYKLMDDFNLVFGAFDFIVTPTNEWIFLEVNPNGQWLWLEQSLKLDISKEIVEYLIS